MPTYAVEVRHSRYATWYIEARTEEEAKEKALNPSAHVSSYGDTEDDLTDLEVLRASEE